MTYAIVLDCNQKQVDIDQYAISFVGTLAECKAQTIDTGNFWADSRDKYSQGSSGEVSLSGNKGQIHASISESDMMARLSFDPVRSSASPPAGIWTGILIGFCLGIGAALLAGSARRTPR